MTYPQSMFSWFMQDQYSSQAQNQVKFLIYIQYKSPMLGTISTANARSRCTPQMFPQEQSCSDVHDKVKFLIHKSRQDKFCSTNAE